MFSCVVFNPPLFSEEPLCGENFERCTEDNCKQDYTEREIAVLAQVLEMRLRGKTAVTVQNLLKYFSLIFLSYLLEYILGLIFKISMSRFCLSNSGT